MGTLFLSGGGDRKHTEKFDEEFRQQIGQAKPLLYIPIAMEGMISYEDCYQWMKDVFNPLDIHEIVMWTDLHHKSVNDLKQFSAVYIGGGNTFYLLNEMRSSGFDEVLKEYIEGDGVVYGGSAGAIILGSNIMTCAYLDENTVGMRDFDGLDVLDGLAVWCHYERENDESILHYIRKFNTLVIALPEETGAYYHDGHIKVTSTKPAFLFDGVNKIELEPSSDHSLHEIGTSLDEVGYERAGIFGNQQPFNDAVAHMQNIEGYPGAGDYKNLETMPKPLQFFGYFIVGLMGVSLMLIVVLGWIFQ